LIIDNGFSKRNLLFGLWGVVTRIPAYTVHKGISLLKTLPFNYNTCEWSGKHFDQTFKSKWVPKNIPTLILAGEKDQIIPLDLFISSKKFKRKNIIIRSIKNAGHFPWIENPKQVVNSFNEYYEFLLKKNREK